MKPLFKYLKEYRKESILSPLFKLFEAGLELAVPLVMAALIDRGIAGGDTGFILRMCLLLAALLGSVCAAGADEPDRGEGLSVGQAVRPSTIRFADAQDDVV